MKIFIDCDPGVDDSIAILFALFRKDVEIVGISTSVGNVSASKGAENAMRILKLAGYEGKVPVCAGAEKPLRGECEDFPTFIHGDNGTEMWSFPQRPSAQWTWMFLTSCIRRPVITQANWF